MRPPACVPRGAVSSATLGAIPHRCANRLHRHARQFCATVSSTTNSNFVRRQKDPGRSAPPICENVPAVASEQAATGVRNSTGNERFGVVTNTPLRATRHSSMAADVLRHRAGVAEIKAGILERKRPSVRPNKGQA